MTNTDVLKRNTDVSLDAKEVVSSDNPVVMYEKCITCKDVGSRCNGPNMLILDIEQVREMCRQRKKILGITSQQITDACEFVEKSSIDRFLSHKVADFRYTVVHDIVRAIIRYGQGHQWEKLGDNPCPATSSEIQAKLLGIDNVAAEKDAKIEALKAELKSVSEDKDKKVDYLKGQVSDQVTALKWYRKVISTLVFLCFFLVALVVTALVVDRMNPNIGFFWLE